mgnify:CR=1 FL=1
MYTDDELYEYIKYIFKEVYIYIHIYIYIYCTYMYNGGTKTRDEEVYKLFRRIFRRHVLPRGETYK